MASCGDREGEEALRRNDRLLMLANLRRDSRPQIARRQFFAPLADRLREDVVLLERLVIGFSESSLFAHIGFCRRV